jgi:CRISPR-associated protein Cas1
MKRLLNTLFVTTQGTYLARKGNTVVVRVDGETKMRFPVHNLDGIVCFGRVSCSPPLMELCTEQDVTISFLSPEGRFCGRVQGPASGNVLLRRQQYRWADNKEKSAEIARNIIMAKIANSRNVLLRAKRDHPEKIDMKAIEMAVNELNSSLRGLKRSHELRVIRGHEGKSARTYFGVLDSLITSAEDGFSFGGRNRRPPLDPVNSMLSFYYTLLLHDCVSALESVGLDPAVGFLHRDKPGRPGLALDLMEEFRVFLADRLTLSLINRRQIKTADFKESESGAVIMTEDARKQVLVTYQKRKQEEIRHPFLEEKMETGMLPYAQALLMARYIRGDMNTYPPLIWR